MLWTKQPTLILIVCFTPPPSHHPLFIVSLWILVVMAETDGWVDFQEEKSRGRTVQKATLKRYFCNGFGVKVGCPCCGWNPTTLSLSLRILSEIKTFYVSSTQSLVVTTSTNLWTDRLFDLLCLINWYKKSLHPLVNIWRTGGPGHHGPVWGPFQITQ